MELMGTRLMPVPSSSASWRAKCVLPMPGGPSSSMGVTSNPSRLSCASATWRLTSSSTSVKLGSCSYSAAMSGTPEGLTWKRSGPRSSMRSYTARRGSWSRAALPSCSRESLRSTSTGWNTLRICATGSDRAGVWGTRLRLVVMQHSFEKPCL